MRILILGANGFIGSHLSKAILDRTDWRVVGVDIRNHKLESVMDDERFTFHQEDIGEDSLWLRQQIEQADVVLPLVAIATPADYVTRPLDVFNIDFDANLRIIRDCARFGTRVVYPSSSEVYGMSDDEVFEEDTTNFTYGPTHKSRWIYAQSKSLLERVIHAYGQHGSFSYTIIRPFNWIGPNLDNPEDPKEGSSRVVAQFIRNILNREPIRLINGGNQTRCFTYIADGIDCIMRILEDRDASRNQIFNIGNPANDISIRSLADMMLGIANRMGMVNVWYDSDPVIVPQELTYGEGYQDMTHRKPDVRKAKALLGWEPTTNLDSALGVTMAHYLKKA